MPLPLDENEILRLLKEEGGRPKSFKELKARLGIRASQARELKALLRRLAKGKSLDQEISSAKSLLTGTLMAHPKGFGFVDVGDGKGDVFLPAEELREALHGDTVVVRLRRRRPTGPREGTLLKIVSRGRGELVGQLVKQAGKNYLVAHDRRIHHHFFIPRERLAGAREGQVVVARITEYPSRWRVGQAEIAEVLGEEGQAQVEAHLIMHKHDLPHQFSPEAIQEAQAVPKRVGEEEMAGRIDLRRIPTVTIDPEEAYDFDDAVSVIPLEEGQLRLLVSISDVSHYVRPGSAIDNEAYQRSTSVYFPDFAVPMLPRELSQGICCLHPEEDRLTMTVAMDFDQEGHLLDYTFFKSVIRSERRLTYEQVRSILEDGDAGLPEKFRSVTPHLFVMRDLALKLSEMRDKRGSLDFDLPDPELIRDAQGRITAIGRVRRNLAHRVIEEFMVAANESVATFLASEKLPLLYRIHEPPDGEDVTRLRSFLKSLGIPWHPGKRLAPADFQKVVKQVEGTRLEATVNYFLLRSLKQARYHPENVGHFGLALDYYTHFTSPIRRYPDLAVHRVLSAFLKRRPGLPPLGPAGLDLHVMGEYASQRERVAMEAEREMWDLKKAELMQDKVGQVYSGMVTSILPFGFFVELSEFFVQGLVHLETLRDDHYRVDALGSHLKGRRRGKVIQLGDDMMVRVIGVDVKRRQIDLALVSVKRP